MQSSLSNTGTFLAVTLSLVAGCALSAPPLPTDTTSINRARDLTIDDFTPEARAMNCDEIALERRKTADTMQGVTRTLDESRERNLVITRIGVLVFTPLLLAAENNSAEKDQISKLYERQDMLIKLATLKRCPSPTQ